MKYIKLGEYLIIFYLMIETVSIYSDVFVSDISFPYKNYYANPGIFIISVLQIGFRLVFIFFFFLLIIKRLKNNKSIFYLYLGVGLIIAALQWFEYYYGSTFYYGEVRDKQGLWFPILSSSIITLIIWKIDYSKIDKRNLIIKTAITLSVNIGLIILYRLVYEPWHLWQS